ncbi:MAG: aldo/keto reductase [Thermoprotei archaeon]|nr:MAG: aldo/keto reductase [Thermoprotei archaeon]
MEYRILGRSGFKVSVVGLGTWQFSEAWGVLEYERAKEIVSRAVELGINFFDTAAVYGRGKSEEFLGRAIKELGVRDDVYIATKLPGEFLSRDDVFRATDKCLKRLGVDVIDLMQVHWPPAWHNFPTCEYMRAIERLINLGKIRHVGLSNFPPELIESARECLSTTDIVSLQVRYNVVERDAEKEIIPYAERNKMTVLAWSPLAKGAVTGKYRPDNLPKFTDVRSEDPLFHPDNFKQVYELVRVIEDVAKKYGKTAPQVSLNWLVMASNTVVPIPGAKGPDQVSSNVGAAGWRMSYDDWRRIDEVSKSLRITRVVW